MRTLILFLVALILAPSAFATDTVTILSPHRKSIQQEFIPKFKKYYKEKYKTEVKVEWLDQGGTSDDIRFLRARFNKKTKTSGLDIFWGGGASTFVELTRDELLDQYTLSKQLNKEIPQSAAGVSLYDKSKTWYASAMSSFGIFYNKKILKMDKLKEPKSWQDLADPKFKGNITLADPRRSGSATIMNTIILQSMGWDKGWELLTAIAGNTSKFTHSSSDPIKAVVSGDAAAAMAIDFYANAKIGDLGKENLGFALPEGQTVIDPDPIAIIKGAPNRKTAERFLEFVLSADAQKLLILPKGAKNGPKMAALGRMAVNKAAYSQTEGQRTNAANPFKMKSFLKLDVDKAAKIQRVFIDLLGATQIDTHKDLKKAWAAIVKRGSKAEEITAFAKLPVTEKELLELAKKWDDNVFRNKTLNKWVAFSRTKFQKIAKGK